MGNIGHMSLVQTYVGTWARGTFPGQSVQSIGLHYLREAVELCMAAGLPREDILHSVNRELSNEKNAHKDVSVEMADGAILLFVLADFMGDDLRQAVLDKMAVNEARTWQPPDEQGVHEHIREA